MDWSVRRNFVKLRLYILPALRKPRWHWIIPLGIGAAIIIILCTLYGSQEPLTSAVGCKSKIAQIVLPQEKERSEYLMAVGQDMQNVEDDYYSGEVNLLSYILKNFGFLPSSGTELRDFLLLLAIRVANRNYIHMTDFVERVVFMCSHQVTVGPEGDGGWDVCIDRKFDITSPCLVYSFGIGNDFRFEKEMEEKFKCEVHAFDPSMSVPSHQYSTYGHFYNIGLDNVDRETVEGGWKMQRLKTIMKELGHEGKTIDYLKMDIEFSEWPALYDIIQSGLIRHIRQLAVEIHTPEMDKPWRPDNACTWCRWDTLSFMLRTLIDLHNAGMNLYYSRTNYRIEFISALTRRHRYCCHNLHFVNAKFGSDV